MCNRGEWRGFHTRYLKTGGDADSPLVVMEQCTSCGTYRAKNIENCAYVPNNESENSSDDLPDPDADNGGSVWGPN